MSSRPDRPPLGSPPPPGGNPKKNRATPPSFWFRFLRLISPPEDRRFVLSDLEEEYQELAEGPGGPRAARRWYRLQVLASTIPMLRRRASSLKTPFDRPLRGVGLALRSLRRNPLVVLVTVVSLALGIGTATSVFTIINAFLFQQSNGLEHPEELVAIYTSTDRGTPYGESSFPDYQSILEESRTLEGAVALRAGFLAFDPPPDASEASGERIIVEIVSGNYFQVLGIRPPLGRGFLPEETRLGSARDVIVLSHDFWTSRFNGDPSILGRPLRLNGRDFTVVGVAPPGLVSRLMRLKVQAWVPFGTPQGIWNATPEELASRRDHDATILGRLKKGQTLEAAQGELTLLAARLSEEHPEAWTDERGQPRTFTVIPEKDSRLPPDARQALAGLGLATLAGAFLVLLIACSNVASLFLARAHRRRREMAIRLSLGASRLRLAGLLLNESLILALLGGAGGLVLAWAFSEFMASLPLPLDVPLAFDVGLDGRVVGFATLVSLLSAVLFGLVPALRASRPDLVPALKSEGGADGRRPGRLGLRNILVLGQVTAALILLVPAALFFRTIQVGTSTDLGFNPDRVAIMWKTLEHADVNPAGAQRFFLDLEERLEALPEVQDVEVARRAEASMMDLSDQAVLEIPGYAPEQGQPLVVPYSSMTPGFVSMLELPLLRGRAFTDADGPGAPAVAMVNEAFVRRFWPDSHGLGQSFTIKERLEVGTPTPAPSTVVQVVGVLQDPPVMLPGSRAEPFIWLPFFQDYPSRAVIHIKGRTSAAAMVPILRREVPLSPGEVPLIPAQTYADAIRGVFVGHEMASKALTWAGLFALVLAIMGIYGVVSFAVAQRVREMAIRQAIGAGDAVVLKQLIWEGMGPTLLGTGIGLLLAGGVALMLRSEFFGVGPLDPWALGSVTAVLLISALIATLVPARRALRTAPMEVLREE